MDWFLYDWDLCHEKSNTLWLKFFVPIYPIVSPSFACWTMAKHNFKILMHEHHKIFKVNLGIFQHHAWKAYILSGILWRKSSFLCRKLEKIMIRRNLGTKQATIVDKTNVMNDKTNECWSMNDWHSERLDFLLRNQPSIATLQHWIGRKVAMES